jgi:gas vesicle protein
MKTGKILLGVLAALAAGATLGILLAPDSGSDTRKKIIKSGEDYLDSVKSKFNEIFENLSGKSGNGEGKMADFAEKNASNSRGAKSTMQTA